LGELCRISTTRKGGRSGKVRIRRGIATDIVLWTDAIDGAK